MLKMILAGKINQAEARRLEQECLKALLLFDAARASVDNTLAPLLEYEKLYDEGPSREEIYRETLHDSPWKSCTCDICRKIGIHVILFRGAERNRRRGFHNVFVFHQRLHRELRQEQEAVETLAVGREGVR